MKTEIRFFVLFCFDQEEEEKMFSQDDDVSISNVGHLKREREKMKRTIFRPIQRKDKNSSSCLEKFSLPSPGEEFFFSFFREKSLACSFFLSFSRSALTPSKDEEDDFEISKGFSRRIQTTSDFRHHKIVFLLRFSFRFFLSLFLSFFLFFFLSFPLSLSLSLRMGSNERNIFFFFFAAAAPLFYYPRDRLF